MPSPSRASKPVRLRFGRLLEEIGGFLPAPQTFQANRQIQVRVGVLGMHAEQLGVALRGILIHFQLKLDLGLRGEDIERAFSGFENPVDLASASSSLPSMCRETAFARLAALAVSLGVSD